MALLERGTLEFGALDGTLRLRLLAHHAGPVHLSHADLARLGLWLSAPPETLPSSRLLEPDGSEPEGLEVGDYLLLAVREGLDVFVQEPDAGPAFATRATLARLGLYSRTDDRRGGA